jgi:hypothetical protein
MGSPHSPLNTDGPLALMLYLGYFFNAKLAQSVGKRARNGQKTNPPSFQDN